MNSLSLLLTLSALMAGVFGCQYPPEHWCDSPEIAKECEVYDECRRIMWSPRSEASPVQIALYYESLCPGCMSFISGQLAEAVKKVGSIMEVDLVPYGNAKERQEGGKWVFTCQHGSEECKGNVIESCAISELKNFTTYWPFILCIETSTTGSFDRVAPECASKTGVSYEVIKSCAEGSKGNSVEHQMAQKTEALNPPHQYTPWITVNGEHTEILQNMAQSHLVKLVCKKYQGTKPPACSEYEDEKQQRCYKE